MANWYTAATVVAVIAAIIMMMRSRDVLIHGHKATWVPWALAVFVFLYLGSRPVGLYGDSKLYSDIYFLVQHHYWPEVPPNEPFFMAIENFCLDAGWSCTAWYLCIAALYVFPLAIAVRRWLPRHFMLGLIFFFASFSFFSYGTNGIRNGVGTSLALLGLSYFCRSKKDLIIGIGILLAGMMFHSTIALPLVCGLVALRFHNVRVGVGIWIGCAILAFLLPDSLKEFVTGLGGDSRLQTYVSSTADAAMFSRTGYRWDFMLFSLPPILLGWYAIVAKGIKDHTYEVLLLTYIYANSFWLLINSAAYSNRFAYLSWFMMPIVIAYPLLRLKIFKNQGMIAAMFLLMYCLIGWFTG